MFYQFKKLLYHFNSIKDLHFKLMNILPLIYFVGGSFYCLCQKYSGCEKYIYNQGKDCCGLCRVQIKFSNFKEQLNRNEYDLDFLRRFAFELSRRRLSSC